MEEFVSDSSDLIRDVFEACAEDSKQRARLQILSEVAKSKRIHNREDIAEFFLSVQEEIQLIHVRLKDGSWETQLCDMEDFDPEANLTWIAEEKRLAQVMHLLLLWDSTCPLPSRMRGKDFDEGIRMIGSLLTQCGRQFKWAETFIGRLQKRM